MLKSTNEGSLEALYKSVSCRMVGCCSAMINEMLLQQMVKISHELLPIISDNLRRAATPGHPWQWMHEFGDGRSRLVRQGGSLRPLAQRVDSHDRVQRGAAASLWSHVWACFGEPPGIGMPLRPYRSGRQLVTSLEVIYVHGSLCLPVIGWHPQLDRKFAQTVAGFEGSKAEC